MNQKIYHSNTPGEIQKNYFDHFPKMDYADGPNRPRGIAIHETANPTSTIWNEITYMSNNYLSAFVQAFVDQNNIIEIHPPEYAAWELENMQMLILFILNFVGILITKLPFINLLIIRPTIPLIF